MPHHMPPLVVRQLLLWSPRMFRVLVVKPLLHRPLLPIYTHRQVLLQAPQIASDTFLHTCVQLRLRPVHLHLQVIFLHTSVLLLAQLKLRPPSETQIQLLYLQSAIHMRMLVLALSQEVLAVVVGRLQELDNGMACQLLITPVLQLLRMLLRAEVLVLVRGQDL